MLQYLLTALAGLALGIVGMRLWQSIDKAPSSGGAPVTSDEANDSPDPEQPRKAPNRKLLIGAGGLAVVAVAALALRPESANETGESATGAGNAMAAPGDKKLDDVDTMITRLAARLEKQPEDGEGWRMLGWSLAATGHPDKAVEPYKRALALLPKNASVNAGYGEALTAVAGGKVSPEAKALFDKAVALDPAEPRARNFEALWLAQNGKEREALDKYVALANSAPPETPWQTEVRGKIEELSKKLGVDVSDKLKAQPVASAMRGPDAATVQAAQQLPAGQRQAMVDGMVEGLAAKLKADPKNADGWAMLLRSRMVMKQGKQAGEDLAIARKALAGDAAGLARVNQAAAQLGVPGAR